MFADVKVARCSWSRPMSNDVGTIGQDIRRQCNDNASQQVTNPCNALYGCGKVAAANVVNGSVAE